MIPEETEVFVPPYCLHRNGDYFSDPDEFIPGRWLGEGSATVTPDAYIPFSRGPANCAGRNLARIEMLMIASLLFHTFDFQIANEDDFKQEVWEDGLKDIFVFTRGKLRVSLTKRT
jgi:cytochrome P450